MFNEFKEFAMKGNLVDMAVGFILGGAFGTVVKSLVSDIIMPPVGLLLGGVDFSAIKTTLQPVILGADGAVVTEAVTINWGLFIDNVIAFVIVAWVMFMIIKAMNSAKKKEEEEAPAAPPADEVLLTEIRDLLAKQG